MRYSVGLQSGATDGAVSWGVLDRLLEDERVELEAISGASSGAVNTIVCGYGLATGGREHARALLERFWRLASQRGGIQLPPSPLADVVFGRGSLAYLPQFWASSAFVQATSPYLWNPLGYHIVRELLASVVDFERLRESCPLRLFVSATDVLKGKARVFRNHELTLDVAVASTCLPLYVPAQRLGESYFWDGGLIGAPKLQPLVDECEAEDIILIRVSPVERPDVPRSAFSIIERTIELSVAAGVDEELKRIEMISRLIKEGRLQPGEGARRVRLHRLEGTAMTRDLPFSGKYNLDWQFLCGLRDFGRAMASDWLKTAPHAASVKPGQRAASRFGAQALAQGTHQ